ncbi:MAG: hypothetical protein HFG93_10695 [Dorea sp.]|jgi:hypothetical protein|nr:hypothetical protein [Dorea sp.]
MQLPLNVILYRLSANSIYESQNTSLSKAYDGVKLFDRDYTPEDGKQYLYLMSEDILCSYSSRLFEQQFLTTDTFLCVCQNKDTHPEQFHPGLSLVLLYSDDTFPNVFNKVLTIFHDFEVWDTNFHLALLQNRPLKELLDLTTTYIVHPMVILDRNFSLLGYVKTSGTGDPIMEDILKAGYVTPDTMTRLRQDGLVSASENAPNPMINYYCLTTHECYYSMMYRFTASNHTVGYALVFRCSMHPKTNYLDLMNIISGNLKLYFQQERFRTRSSSEIYESLFTEILENPNASVKQYEDQASFIPGLDMEGYFRLARISYDNTSDMPYSFISWNLRSASPMWKPFVYENALYVLRINTASEKLGDFLLPGQESLFLSSLNGISFTCGISNTFFSLMDLPAAVLQCNEAIRLGRLKDEPLRQFYQFKDVFVPYILQELKKVVPSEMLSSPCYEILKRYDRKNHTDLCEIFMQYLENERSIGQTSNAIFLHRNTVQYKVKKAISVMGNECSTSQAAVAFILAYMNDRQI